MKEDIEKYIESYLRFLQQDLFDKGYDNTFTITSYTDHFLFKYYLDTRKHKDDTFLSSFDIFKEKEVHTSNVGNEYINQIRIYIDVQYFIDNRPELELYLQSLKGISKFDL